MMVSKVYRRNRKLRPPPQTEIDLRGTSQPSPAPQRYHSSNLMHNSPALQIFQILCPSTERSPLKFWCSRFTGTNDKNQPEVLPGVYGHEDQLTGLYLPHINSMQSFLLSGLRLAKRTRNSHDQHGTFCTQSGGIG